VHVRISSPPTTGACFYGIDTPDTADLIAHNKSVEEVCQFIGADSLGYLSEAGLYTFLRAGEPRSFCDACFTGRYPLSVDGTSNNRTRTCRVNNV
jgi:amidophosphoribosyltransferase